MQGFKSKILYLSFGVVIGLLIGGGFFIFKVDELIKDFDEQALYEKLAERIEELYADKEEEVAEEGEEGEISYAEASEIEEDNEGPEFVAAPVEDTLPEKKVEMGWQLNEGVKLEEVLAIDSLLDDDFPDLVVEEAPAEEIIVKKDELLSTRMVAINDLNEIEEVSTSTSDSLLAEVSGVQLEEETGTYLVEFWQSPLNYQGYKMAKNKIVLFGISQPEEIKIYQFEDQVYMKYLDNVYRVALTNEFEQLEIVGDEYVLMQING